MRSYEFFQDQESGGYAAWSLHNPTVPEFGHWAWVDLQQDQVRFLKTMTEVEISNICRRYNVWGAKLTKAPWAMVCGVPRATKSDGSYQSARVTASDSGVGV